MNYFLSNRRSASRTIRRIKFSLIPQITAAIVLLLASACAQSGSADVSQTLNKGSSPSPTVSPVQVREESLISEIRKAFAGKDHRQLAELLKSKPNLDVRNKTNDSLLVEAMRADIKSFEMLLEAGADPNFKSEVAGCAESERCSKPPSYIAFESENLAALKLLLQYRADPNGESLLAWAVSRGNREAVELLLSFKADVNFNDHIGENRQPPIFFADDPKIADQLIKNGADVNRADSNESTPLMAAVREDNLEMARFYIKNGAAVNARNKNGETILQLAKNGGNNKILSELKKAGAR